MRTESKPPGAPPDDPVRAALDDEQLRARLCAQARAMLHRLPAGRREEIAEDLAHEAITRALRNRDQYVSAKGPVACWLQGILVHVVCDHFRAAGRRPAVQAPEDAAAWERLAVDLLSPAADQTVSDRLDAAGYLGRLSPDDRALMLMRHWEDLDSAAIAARLGGTPGLVRVRLCRVHKRLQAISTGLTREVGQ
jgi:RNA polymerase sigma factor (sigma-70 family)